MTYSLEGCRLKVDRAKRHLDCLRKECRQWFAGESQAEVVNGWTVLSWRFPADLPLVWGVAVGDVIHNVRSALDHLVWEAVRANNRNPNDESAFPICVTQVEWWQTAGNRRSSGQSCLRGIAQDTLSVIERVQPYLKPNKAAAESTELAVIRAVSNFDKHRTLPVQHVLTGPHLEPPEVAPGVEVEAIQWLVGYRHRVESGTPLVRYKLRKDPTPEGEMAVVFTLPVSIGFKYGRLDILTFERIERLIETVDGVIDDVGATLP